MGPYNVGYRWAPYMDPIAVAMIHALSVVFWVHLFWHLFYDGDHHLPLMASVEMPVFDMQMRTLFLNEELGLPATTPSGESIGAESVSLTINFKNDPS